MSHLINRELILVKENSVYRTDSTPVPGTDDVKVENFTFNPADNVQMVEPAPIQAGFVPDAHLVASQLYNFSFDCEIKGSGAAGTAPEIGPLLKACGHSETVSASTSVTYKPASTGITSCTIWFYSDGILAKATGCRGTVSFKMAAHERMMASFAMTGHRLVATADVALGTPSYVTTVAQPFQGATFTIDGYAAIITDLEFDAGSTLSIPKDINQANGFGEIQIVAPRNITGSFNPEAVLVATEAFEANWLASTSMVLSTGTIGSVAGNITAWSMPVVRYREMALGDKEGILQYEMGFQAYDSAGDDAYSLIFT